MTRALGILFVAGCVFGVFMSIYNNAARRYSTDQAQSVREKGGVEVSLAKPGSEFAKP